VVGNGLERRPDVFKVDLPEFSGPLDLFVHLVRDNKVDLFTISVLSIVRSLARSIAVAGRMDLDAAADALFLTSELVFWKSRLLLPGLVEEAVESEEEGGGMLVEKVLEYEQARVVALSLAEREAVTRAMWYSGESQVLGRREEDEIVGASVVDLAFAFLNLLSRSEAEEVQHIARERYSIADGVGKILGILRGRSSVTMRELFGGESEIEEKLVLFLALLELVRFSVVVAFQRRGSFNITLRLCKGVDVAKISQRLGLGPNLEQVATA